MTTTSPNRRGRITAGVSFALLVASIFLLGYAPVRALTYSANHDSAPFAGDGVAP